MAKKNSTDSKSIYSATETVNQVHEINKNNKTNSNTTVTTTTSAEDKKKAEEKKKREEAKKKREEYKKNNTYYSDGYYWLKNQDGTSTKVSRWTLDNQNGLNPTYAKDSEYRDLLSTTFGTYDKKYNPTGVKSTNAKLTGKDIKIANNHAVSVKVNNKYTVIILDSKEKYSKNDINKLVDTASSGTKYIVMKDTDVKSNINTNMDLSKLSRSQISNLIKGKVTPTLSIKDDGKTIIVTDKNGKKHTIKFNSKVSELGNVTGIGKLTDLYTKGFSLKQITALRKLATTTAMDSKYSESVTNMKTRLGKIGKTNASILGDRVNATIETNTDRSKRLRGLRAVQKSDSNFGIWKENDGTTTSASSYTYDEKTGTGTGSYSYSTPAAGARTSANYDKDGTLQLKAKQVVSDIELKAKTTVRRLNDSQPFPAETLMDKPDKSWKKNRGEIGSIYESGIGKSRETILHSIGIWEKSPKNYLDWSSIYYNRFKLGTPDSVLQKTFAHVFFVRPHCNVKLSANGQSLDEASHDNQQFVNNPNYMYAASNSPNLVKEISYDVGNQNSDFSFILSNAAKSFSLNDEYINSDNYGTGYTGYKVAYGKHGVESRTAGDFTVTFQDDKNLSIYRMIKLWADYIEGCYTGNYHPKQSTILNHELDYTGAVYYILTAEDGETILFWSKYYGVFPTTIPSNQYSWSAGTLISQINLDVKFNYSWKEDYNIAEIAEFNYNSHLENIIGSGKTVNWVPTYNENLGTAGRTWVGAPFIETIYENGDSYGHGNMVFKLRFRSE